MRAAEPVRVGANVSFERIGVASPAAGVYCRCRFPEGFELFVETRYKAVAQFPVHPAAHVDVGLRRIAEVKYEMPPVSFTLYFLEHCQLVLGPVVAGSFLISVPKFREYVPLHVGGGGKYVQCHGQQKKQ